MINGNIKNKDFDSKGELIDYLLEQLDNKKDITLVVNRDIAKEIATYFEEEDFEDYFAIEYASDVNEYFVEKYENSHFCVGPAKYKDKYLEGETEELIIMEEFLNNELLKATKAEKIAIVEVEENEDSNDDFDDEDESDECNCSCCNCNCCNNESDNDESDNEVFNLVDEYYELMKDNDFDENAVKQALWEFGQIVLERFEIDEEE